ncbi:FtsW/RodA/SpoVE family cell cycle protein [Sporosarcina aquimarina]|uniref:Probable peptidoglycan glycosyltransferase FtsW n=1 Tax=Sporosarcina aquimarina TaxID=114975 RepID=A0ABU4FXB3_9BACL|nr:FtsW/RodA/SpoVE family cell cycle protein [Sporosarcina aquimarina]MDW0109351.1 FtsW/RodA/SpoVE family cell cycle protein [Sporosarcina aquimarina]
MKSYAKRLFRHFDFPLFFTYLVLCLFGLIMIYSSSMVWAVNRYGWEPDKFFNQQLASVCIAIPAFFVTAFLPYKLYRKKYFMMFSVALMLILLGLVHVIGFGGAVGSQSWINLPIGSLQPSELAKIVMVIYFAGVFANKYDAGTINSINTAIVPPVIILGIAVASVMSETDIGATFIIIAVSLCVMATSGINIKTFGKLSVFVAGILVLVAIFLYFSWDSVMTESRMGRFTAYKDPFKYIQGSGLQIVNGYIAIGAGGLFGLGLGNSVQKMGYLPEPHTDFIMAIISEELGIFGTTIVIGGLGFLVIRAFMIALKTRDPHARMLASGIGALIGIQTFVNLGGLTGLIPLTGVTLPFISYGGTSIILLSLALGILMNVSMFTRYEKNK